MRAKSIAISLLMVSAIIGGAACEQTKSAQSALLTSPVPSRASVTAPPGRWSPPWCAGRRRRPTAHAGRRERDNHRRARVCRCSSSSHRTPTSRASFTGRTACRLVRTAGRPKAAGSAVHGARPITGAAARWRGEHQRLFPDRHVPSPAHGPAGPAPGATGPLTIRGTDTARARRQPDDQQTGLLGQERPRAQRRVEQRDLSL